MLRVTLTKFTSKCHKFTFHLSSKNNRSRTFCDHLPRILIFFTEYTEWQIRIFLTCKLKTNFKTFITLKGQNLQISSYKLMGNFQTIF